MRQFTIEAAEDVRAIHSDAVNVLTVCDAVGEFLALPHDGREKSDWNGNLTHRQATQMATDGDLSAVADSDAFMSKMESTVILSGKRAWIDDVAGAVPNIGAYLAGSPMNMRYRRKMQNESAPIALVFCGTVAAVMRNSDMRRRGALALALSRTLSVSRPVELWYFVGFDAGYDTSGKSLPGSHNASGIFVRIDSSPLDIARASFMLAHVSATRMLGYGKLKAGNAGRGHGGWLWGDEKLQESGFIGMCRQALPHIIDVLAIPAHLGNNDPMLKDPEGWLKAQVALYAGGES